MLSITDLKKDTLIQIDDTPYRVVDYAQKQMGRGGSIVNTKLKNLIDGSVIPKTFKGNEKIEEADVTNEKVQYLYADKEDLFFMNGETYEQFSVGISMLGKTAELLKEGLEVQAQKFEGNIININLPIKVTLQITDAPEVTKGDTQSTVQKEAILETGAKVQVPMFIKTGEQIVVDTRDFSYVERFKG